MFQFPPMAKHPAHGDDGATTREFVGRRCRDRGTQIVQTTRACELHTLFCLSLVAHWICPIGFFAEKSPREVRGPFPAASWQFCRIGQALSPGARPCFAPPPTPSGAGSCRRPGSSCPARVPPPCRGCVKPLDDARDGASPASASPGISGRSLVRLAFQGKHRIADPSFLRLPPPAAHLRLQRARQRGGRPPCGASPPRATLRTRRRRDPRAAFRPLRPCALFADGSLSMYPISPRRSPP